MTVADLSNIRIKAVDILWRQLCAALPNESSPDSDYWTTGTDEILSKDQQAIDFLADMFDEMYGEGTVNTGYYDPVEDARNGEVDCYTGYYYCNNA